MNETWCIIEKEVPKTLRWEYVLPEDGYEGQVLLNDRSFESICNTFITRDEEMVNGDVLGFTLLNQGLLKEFKSLKGYYIQINGSRYRITDAEPYPDNTYFIEVYTTPSLPDDLVSGTACVIEQMRIGRGKWGTALPVGGEQGQVLTRDIVYEVLQSGNLLTEYGTGPDGNEVPYALTRSNSMYAYPNLNGLYLRVGNDRFLVTKSYYWEYMNDYIIQESDPPMTFTQDQACYVEKMIQPGAKWQNLFPEGGNEGDALVKSASGYTWAAVNTASDAQAMADAAEANAKAYADTLAQNKVDKEAGKGLSSNDFTSAEKEKLDSLSPLPEGGTSGQVLAKKKTEFSVTFNRAGHTGTNDRIVLQNLSEVPGYPNIAANSLVGYTLKGRYASGSGYVDYQDKVIGNDAQSVQDDVEILKLTMQGSIVANEKSFAPEMILNSNDDGLEWADRLEPDNILAGRNVTLDRMGRNITINCDAAGSGGSIANADTVDGYHVNDTKGGTDATTDNALWSAYKIKQFIENSAGDVPKITLEQCNDYTIDGIFVGDFSANQNGVLNNGGKSLVFSQYSPDAPHFYNYQLIISFNGFTAYITHRHYTATDPWTVTFNKYIPYMVTSHTSSATLGTNWAGTSAPYTQTVNVNGMTSNARPLICPNYSSDNATAIAEQKAWNKIGKILVGNGTITAYCFEEKPTTAINLQIEVME